MSESLSVEESDKANWDTADVLVRVSKKVSLAPLVKKFANINVYTKKKNGNGDVNGALITESNKSENESKIEDFQELNFEGSIKVWNKETLTQDDVDSMASYGETLVVTSSKKEEILKNSSNLDFKNLIVWITQNSSLDSDCNAFAKMPNRGVFYDSEKKGKLLFALTKLLKNPETLQFSSQISSTDFKGIVDLALAHQLDDLGISYFFKANDLCWARGFWIGAQQARSIYADKSVLHDIKESISRMVQKGRELTEETLSVLETMLLQTLQTNPFVTKIINIHIPVQKLSSQIRGIVSGVSIQYETSKEIRTVFIELDSSGD